MDGEYVNLPDQNSAEGYSLFDYMLSRLTNQIMGTVVMGGSVMNTDDLKWALTHLNDRLPQYAEYQAYYDGDHILSFATEKFRSAFGNTLKRLVDNLCPKVVDVLADRLRVTGFTCELDKPPEDDTNADEVAETKFGDIAWDIWKRNRMPRWAGVQVTSSLTLGDSYGLVWPDPKNRGKAKIYIHRGDQMIVKYSAEDPNVISFAMKWWVADDGNIRVNMYYADHIDRYITLAKPSTPGLPIDEKLFGPYTDDPDKMGATVPNPYKRVPVFHFPNGVGPGMMGRSELKPVIPIQNALNKALADMMVAMEFVGLPQRYATGVDTGIDEETGKDALDQFEAAVDRLWATENENARFGEFPAADITHFLEVQEKLRVEIARVSSTPIHHIQQATNDAPSGESLKTAEAPLTAKQDDRGEAFGEVWAELMAFAVLIETGKQVLYDVQWKDTVPRNSKDFLEGLQIKKDLGVTDKFIKQEMGYTDAEINKMKQEKEVTSTDMGDALLGAFDSGQPSRPVITSDTMQAVGVQPVTPMPVGVAKQ